MIAFFGGLFVGFWLGFILMALLSLSSKGAEINEQRGRDGVSLDARKAETDAGNI